VSQQGGIKMAVPKRVVERISGNLKSFQTILLQQKTRDVSEADTVTLVKDILSDILGYDKYAELTSEHNIRNTFCDLAIKLDNKLAFLLEVKAIGIELKDNHIKQAVDYAANQGCEWVVLTNAAEWRLYQVLFKKPISKHEVVRLDMLSASTRKQDDLEKLYALSREGLSNSAMNEYRDKKDATSRFMIAAILLHAESVKSVIRREIHRVTDIIVTHDIVEEILMNEVLKRETIEGEQAASAARRVQRCADKTLRDVKSNGLDSSVKTDIKSEIESHGSPSGDK
jgi:predicted type IV restriction endonuclease